MRSPPGAASRPPPARKNPGALGVLAAPGSEFPGDSLDINFADLLKIVRSFIDSWCPFRIGQILDPHFQNLDPKRAARRVSGALVHPSLHHLAAVCQDKVKEVHNQGAAICHGCFGRFGAWPHSREMHAVLVLLRRVDGPCCSAASSGAPRAGDGDPKDVRGSCPHEVEFPQVKGSPQTCLTQDSYSWGFLACGLALSPRLSETPQAARRLVAVVQGAGAAHPPEAATRA